MNKLIHIIGMQRGYGGAPPTMNLQNDALDSMDGFGGAGEDPAEKLIQARLTSSQAGAMLGKRGFRIQ